MEKRIRRKKERIRRFRFLCCVTSSQLFGLSKHQFWLLRNVGLKSSVGLQPDPIEASSEELHRIRNSNRSLSGEGFRLRGRGGKVK